jgi:hypothetical protein
MILNKWNEFEKWKWILKMSLENENYFENLYWIWTMKIIKEHENDFDKTKMNLKK